MKKLIVCFLISIMSLSICAFTSGCNNKIHEFVHYDNADDFSALSRFEISTITGFCVNWLYGDINVKCIEGKENVVVYEKVVRGQYDEDLKMHAWDESPYGIEIQYCASDYTYTGQVVKDLFIEIPFRYHNDVKINILNGNLYTYCLKTTSLDITLNDGRLIMDYCEPDELKVKCLNGSCEINVDSSLKECSIETTRGDLLFTSDVTPDKLDLTTTAGNITAVIPWDADFRAIFKSNSGNFTTGFECTKFKDYYLCGKGNAKINLTTTSGDALLTNLSAIAN